MTLDVSSVTCGHFSALIAAGVVGAIVGGGWWKCAHALQKSRAEHAATEARYRLLMNNLAASVALRDSHGKLTYCNSYTEVLTGYSLAEILEPGEDFFIRIASEGERDRVRRALRVSDAGEPFEFQFQYTDKSGFPRWGETRIAPVLSSGSVVGSLAVTTDATRMVRHQRKVEERNKDLQEFASMLSHDLKAPIVTIKGMTALLKEESESLLPKETREVLGHIRQAALRLEKLVSGILEYSKITSTEFIAESVPLDSVLNEILQDYAPRIEATKSKVRVAEHLPIVIGDRTRVYQIFSNLIGNAIKYRQEGRPLLVTISWEHTALPRHVAISISDNGMGIPLDKVDSIFRPFQRAHTVQAPHIEGSGIGLASVKKLVERLGGSVAAQSQDGTGSTFVVTLKCA